MRGLDRPRPDAKNVDSPDGPTTMPTYLYEVILPDGEEGQLFEVEQPMSDPPLTAHPTTGQPVRRVITAPHIVSKYSRTSLNNTLADSKKLERMGLTKYVKAGDGTYEKQAGRQGPDLLQAD